MVPAETWKRGTCSGSMYEWQLWVNTMHNAYALHFNVFTMSGFHEKRCACRWAIQSGIHEQFVVAKEADEIWDLWAELRLSIDNLERILEEVTQLCSDHSISCQPTVAYLLQCITDKASIMIDDKKLFRHKILQVIIWYQLTNQPIVSTLSVKLYIWKLRDLLDFMVGVLKLAGI